VCNNKLVVTFRLVGDSYKENSNGFWFHIAFVERERENIINEERDLLGV